ncbi:MAG: lamin tail domain-containing protein [Bacteroidales bacterium]|nr:lamin tail domain-containing protein [Bacteroidales bacterium]
MPPEISNINVISGNKIDVVFSEFVEKSLAENILNYNINNSIGNPATATRDISDSAIVHLNFSSAFLNGAENILTVKNVKDNAGNAIKSLNKTFYYYHPEVLDIVINEILFNPKNDGVDFVEIYNRSAKIVDLQEINLCSFDTIKNILISTNAIVQQTYLIQPGEYFVLTVDPDKVKSQYFTSNPGGFIKMNALPSFNNDKGIVVISDKSSDIIDIFKYSEKMHFALLKNVEGVSLERVDFNRLTQDATNWHSASENVGFATPGYKNSQFNNADSSDNAITISPQIFSPDNDGHDDLLDISYVFDKPDYIANVAIYDSNGRLMKSVAKNKRLDAKGIISWDGINETNEKCRIGIYIIYFEVFDLQGKVKHYKKTCVLGGKLK